MKYRYFMINQVFGYEPGTDYTDFFAAIGNYVDPEINMQRHMQYASDYKEMFERLMNELVGGSRKVRALPVYQIQEIDKYDLLFTTASGQTISQSSWTNGANGVVWTISLGGKSKSISTNNWDEIITFIRDNI